MIVKMPGTMSHPVYLAAEVKCEARWLTVPTSHHGEYGVRVQVITPYSLAQQQDRPCLLYAHGGGAVGGRADQFTPYLSLLAARCGVVVFNVDYRKAPATTCPHNVLDFVAVVRHVASRAAQLGVDPVRIGIVGESGGGYICAGAAVELAR